MTARRRRVDATRWASLGLTGLVALALSSIVALLIADSLPVWRHEGFAYLFGGRWFYREPVFGAAAMIYGSAVVAGLALLVATPVALGAAIFTAEFLPSRLRPAVKLPIEMLAGVPSVVYGLLGVLLLRDWVARLLAPFEPLSGDTLATGGLLLALMILPTLMTLSDDALGGVPAVERRAARGLGLSAVQTLFSATLPRALPGLAGAVLLALGRALGETIAVFLVIGRQDNQLPERLLTLAPLVESGQTLTSKLGGSETWLAHGDPLHWGAIAGLGLILMAMVAASTLVGNLLSGRRRRVELS